MKMKMLLSLSLKSTSESTGTNSLPESTMFSLEPPSEKSSRSEPSFSTNSCFPCRVTHVHSVRHHFEMCNFHQFDTHVTDAQTGKGTLDWTKGITESVQN